MFKYADQIAIRSDSCTGQAVFAQEQFVVWILVKLRRLYLNGGSVLVFSISAASVFYRITNYLISKIAMT